jgi:hypothetical protein
MRPRRAARVGIALILALLALGCASDDGASSPPPTTTSASTTASTTSTTTSTTSTSTTSTTTGPARPTSPATTASPTSTSAPRGDGPLTESEAGELVASIEGPMGSWNPDTSTYDPDADLSAIVGSVHLATVSSPQQLFFFHAGRYVATQLEPRFGIGIVATEGGTVTVRYPHYQPTDPNCCPSLPDYVVRFRWSGTAVQPLDPLPPADQGAAG